MEHLKGKKKVGGFQKEPLPTQAPVPNGSHLIFRSPFARS